MKIIYICLFFSVLLTATAAAQKITGIRFSYFLPVEQGSDSLPGTVTVAGYTGTLVDEKFVSENPKTAAALTALIKKIKSNGTADINKCFIPRHCITLLNGDAVIDRVLVCFECDGIRFSSQAATTRVKKVAQREKWMQELKQQFTTFHFDTKGGGLRE